MAHPHTDDPHLRLFASSLEAAIARCGKTDDENFLARQRRQVENLVLLEKQFRRALIGHSAGLPAYEAFIRFICTERRNILDARPYFRERQHVFTQQISKALRRRNPRALMKFNFNFRFVQFVLGLRAWKPRSVITRLAQQITAAREELITMNMPLAISRARIFHSRTPKAHLSYMDFIQIACEGLMSGIDKFVPPFSKAFRAVAIGRMTGNFIEQYSETPIHFYPVDKRKIYRANKLVGKQASVVDFDDLSQRVNQGVDAAHCTTPSEIANLMAAASVVSTDTPISNDDEETTRVADRYAAPADCQPDVICEKMDGYKTLVASMAVLSAFEHKLLRLKGVQLG